MTMDRPQWHKHFVNTGCRRTPLSNTLWSYCRWLRSHRTCSNTCSQSVSSLHSEFFPVSFYRQATHTASGFHKWTYIDASLNRHLSVPYVKLFS